VLSRWSRRPRRLAESGEAGAPGEATGPACLAFVAALVVTFDEDEGTSGNTVLATVIAPGVRHVVASGPCTHDCWTRYAERLAGAPPLNLAAPATSLGAAFGLG
jgi:hypothetical protein